MKVLHIIPSISRKRGGPSTAILKMVSYLRREDVDASILTTTDNYIYSEDSFPLSEWFTLENAPIIMFKPWNSKYKAVREYLLSFKFTFWLLLNISKYDAVHIHSIFSYTSTSSMLIARFTRTPYIVRTIGQLNSWSLLQNKYRKAIMLSLVEKSNLAHALAIHVTSESELIDLNAISTFRKVICLELGVEYPPMLTVKQFQPGDPVRFIFLSRIHPKKQLNKLLEALSILFSNNPDQLWSLVVAGEGESDYIVQLKKLASDGGISEKISWTGHIDGEAKLQVLSSADWFILPSASENFGISAVEALSHGVPVIITREVGIANAVEEYGAGIISEADPYLLYQTLQSALNGPDPCMRTAARRLAHDRYSWQTIAKKLASFYNENIPMRKKS